MVLEVSRPVSQNVSYFVAESLAAVDISIRSFAAPNRGKGFPREFVQYLEYCDELAFEASGVGPNCHTKRHDYLAVGWLSTCPYTPLKGELRRSYQECCNQMVVLPPKN